MQTKTLQEYDRQLDILAKCGDMANFKRVNEEKISYIRKQIEISDRALGFFDGFPFKEETEQSDLEHHGLLVSEVL